MAQAPPVLQADSSLILVAIIIAIGGLLLLTAAAALLLLSIALYLKKPKAPAAKRVVAEPPMPVSIESESGLSPAGELYDSDPDSIATEVFVRTQSLPEDEVDTLDELPGKLLAKKRNE